jgi:hypothetical protein
MHSAHGCGREKGGRQSAGRGIGGAPPPPVAATGARGASVGMGLPLILRISSPLRRPVPSTTNGRL